ncbi:cytochrome P450 [Lophiostoma macrostomum CBS 122681]|uniref:Cytochrome P450 n=1 Tax=Lophiostoma macrostomum CBS 122681 TaxID=1314788 RepID=A0A6A6SIL5_9PLEO|nr:cytochrome P450 [Lophiostoma macrostomum CBS 122681]
MGNSTLKFFAASRTTLSSLTSFFDYKDKFEQPATASVAIYSSIIFFTFIFLLQKAWSRIHDKNLFKTWGSQKPVWYPHKDPILGLDVLLESAKAVTQGLLLEMTNGFFSEFGRTISWLHLGRQAILTVDPDNLKALLATKFHDFGLGAERMNALQPLFGSGIFNSDGETWQHQRMTLRPFMARVGACELAIFETHIQQLLSTFPTNLDTIEIQKSLSSFTLDVSTEVFLGKSTNLLSSTSLAGERFAAAFDYAQRTLYGEDKFSSSLDEIHDFIDNVLDESRAASKDTACTDRDQSFLASVLDQGRTREELKADILNIVLAGKDTMATHLSSIWHFLSQNPSAYARLRSEISVLNSQPPTKDDLNRFPYLNNFLKEVLRLQPPVALNQRTAIRDTYIPHGAGPDGLSPLRVPQGASVGYSVYAMHRLSEYFGDDAEVFRPERWETIRPHWAFVPFHAGPRMCLGRTDNLCATEQYALALAKYSTIRLIQHIQAVEDRNEFPWTEKLGMVCSSMHGVKVALVFDKKIEAKA